jgi:molybdopterin molybdotransferase
MIPVDEAKRLILKEARRLDVVEVGLDEAAGRVLAEDVVADRDFPPTDRSGMDGYAVRWEDVREPGRTLALAGEVQAGKPTDGVRVEPGSCVRITTGSGIPPGADTVVMVELTQEDGNGETVTFRGEPIKGQHIRARGEDVRAGERVLVAGAPIGPAEIAALASVGRTRAPVYRPPVVRIISTGDEVVEPEVTPAPHQVRNSNARCLVAQLRELGLQGRYLGIAPDTRDGLDEAVRNGLTGDVLLVTGGVSMGKYDLVGESLAAAGLKQVFHKVAVRPGKPILVGRAGGCLVVALPGNPVSTFTGFAVFVAPALRKMMGYARCENLHVTAVLAERLKRKPDRATYHLARVAVSEDGFTALPVRTMGSGDVVSMSRANAFVITPAGSRALDPGTPVTAVLWPEFNLR